MNARADEGDVAKTGAGGGSALAGSHGPGGVGRGGHTAGGRPAARGDGDGAARALAPCLETARSLPFDVAPVPCAQGEGAAEASGGWVSEIAAPARCWVPGASPPAGSLALSFALASLSLSLSYPSLLRSRCCLAGRPRRSRRVLQHAGAEL